MAPIVGVQCWIARAVLGWNVLRLARAAGVSRTTVRRFEGGYSLKATTVEQIQRVFEKAGVVFVGTDDGGPGARMQR
jgi:transcriptional regulator with XRE-family HTH domain